MRNTFTAVPAALLQKPHGHRMQKAQPLQSRRIELCRSVQYVSPYTMRGRSFNPMGHCAEVPASEGEEEAQEVDQVEKERVVE
jgi:hypothetical protein